MIRFTDVVALPAVLNLTKPVKPFASMLVIITVAFSAAADVADPPVLAIVAVATGVN
jgi:hypothetical protein